MKNIKRVLYFFVLINVTAFMMLSGCKPAPKENIRIGCILDLTGAVATYGNWSLKGLELAKDDINNIGGVNGKKIQLIVEDGKSSPQDAVSAFNKLVNIDKVKVVIITTGSSSVLSVAPIANEKKVILFTPAASAPEITYAGDYVFRNRLSGLQEVREMADIAYKKLCLKRGAVLYVNNDFGQSYLKVFDQIFRGNGGQILLAENYDQGGSDFRTQLAKIKQSREIDFVYLVGYAVECGQILKQARELGLKTKWLSTIGIESDKVISVAKDAANGVIYTAPRYVLDDANVAPFEDKYFSKFNEHSNLYAANSYDALKIISDIITRDGYDADKIKNGLYKTKDYPGVSGITTFDENGDVMKPVMLKVIKDSKFEIYSEE
jgi:branched-chain amino acid transport system substrate-binding protein